MSTRKLYVELDRSSGTPTAIRIIATVSDERTRVVVCDLPAQTYADFLREYTADTSKLLPVNVWPRLKAISQSLTEI